MEFALTDSGTGQMLYQKAKLLIPGGTQLLSKRPERFLPEFWPAYYSKATGARVWDLDGRCYIDMSYCGIGSTVLGYSDPDVNREVKQAIDRGSMSTLNPAEEVELADLLVALHPWADMARFARCGGEAMAVAVRIARAATGRDLVAFCGYHGWNDWYLAANLLGASTLNDHLLPGLEPAGVPQGLAGTAVPFRYNRIDELEAIVDRFGPQMAAIVMEPTRGQNPQGGFLEGVRAIADRIGAALIFDEVTSGFRVTTGGAHLTLKVMPDLAVFAKAIGNGYPMAAIIGRKGVMQAAQRSFISSTYWTERIGPVAALATIRKFQRLEVAGHLVQMGRAVKAAWFDAASACGLPIRISGLDPLAHFEIDHPDAQAAKTLYTQEMLQRGFLANNAFYAMMAHTDEDVQAYGRAAAEIFPLIQDALEKGDVRSRLKGPVSHPGFSRLT